jgi:hypothetical protein
VKLVVVTVLLPVALPVATTVAAVAHVAVGVGVAVAVAVGVAVAVAVDVGVGVNVAVAVAVAAAVAVAVGVGVGVAVGAGRSAIKMAPQSLFTEFVADPVPVEPAAAFMAHPAPTVSSLFMTFPYNWLRAPGDVVENEVSVAFSNVAANIRTAALEELVVIEVTPEILVPVPVV